MSGQMTAYFHGNMLVSSEMSGGDGQCSCVNMYISVYSCQYVDLTKEPKTPRISENRSDEGVLSPLQLIQFLQRKGFSFQHSQKCWSFHFMGAKGMFLTSTSFPWVYIVVRLMMKSTICMSLNALQNHTRPLIFIN